MPVSSILQAVAGGVAQSPMGSGGTAAPEPITSSFTHAQVAAGVAGPVNTTSNAAKRYLNGDRRTQFFGRIRGTEALLTINSDFGFAAGVVSASIDGGAFADSSVSGGKVVLFTGLTDEYHTVIFRPGAAYGNSVYLPTSGDVLDVTGVSPALDVPSSMVQCGLAGDFTASALSNHTANFVPTQGYSVRSSTNGASVGSLGFSGSPTKLFISTKSTAVFVSVDGAAPTAYTSSIGGGSIVTCDGAAHDYYVWDGGTADGNSPHLLTVGADVALSDLASEKRLHHFGHSIVYGTNATTPGHTDMSRTAARNGYVFNNLGVAGNTIAALNTRMSSILGLLTVTASDVALIDIGRNDTSTGMSAGNETDYNSIIDACLTKGYGKVLCLGQMNDAGASFTGFNTDLSDLITVRADPDVIYIDRSDVGYTNAARADGVHPTDAGYVTMDGLNITYIDPSLP